MNANADLVREALRRHGMDPDLARHIDITQTEGADGPRGLVTIGYGPAGRRRETAMVSTPTPGEAIGFVMDREKIAPLLALGVRAMPPAERPELPDWIARHPQAQATRQALKRARTLASDATEGRVSNEQQETDTDRPF